MLDLSLRDGNAVEAIYEFKIPKPKFRVIARIFAKAKIRGNRQILNNQNPNLQILDLNIGDCFVRFTHPQ
ncbi:hypothetical protein OFO03_07545 [Campylobacter sp. JMF_02 ED1]|uniref:hypothetical protein n=1 Tax=unclassified Campylobacter TaxID=2593542 RepID=UPI0022E9CC2C|nr:MULTISPECIES: hypothetical protein [unclassified Campylobacter]MDA3050100.1 hypothetical protein [Campylobacter sp. JMF_15 NE4]MDA3051754.1 hypothetical protein [Campylobacter sp. JMF_02 ED1]